jgi:hypothetical protein
MQQEMQQGRKGRVTSKKPALRKDAGKAAKMYMGANL